jgi:steroid 5-alpha reductase family enzyme
MKRRIIFVVLWWSQQSFDVSASAIEDFFRIQSRRPRTLLAAQTNIAASIAGLRGGNNEIPNVEYDEITAIKKSREQSTETKATSINIPDAIARDPATESPQPTSSDEASGKAAVSKQTTSNKSTTFVPKRHTLPSLPSYWKRHGKIWKDQVASMQLSAKPLQLSMQQSWQVAERHSTQFVSTMAASIIAVFIKKQCDISFGRLYALALLGSSVGFYLFLYFISVGYALGVALPVTVALFCYKRHTVVNLSTTLHSLFVSFWGLRLLVFLLWREYINWPALHRKVVQVNESQSPSTIEKAMGWLLYSLLYICMLSPCWFRLQENRMNGTWSNVLLAVQLSGLVLESVADMQKSLFKVSAPSNRYEWCHQGLWKWSTHPNYLGEWLFWLGTYLGGWSTKTSFVQWLVMSTGFAFLTWVLRGATMSLEQKYGDKYGKNPAYIGFTESHTFWGPAFWTRSFQPTAADTDPVVQVVLEEEMPDNEEETILKKEQP